MIWNCKSKKMPLNSNYHIFGPNYHKFRFCDITLVMKMFNHSSDNVTLWYTGVTQDDMDAAVQALDLYIKDYRRGLRTGVMTTRGVSGQFNEENHSNEKAPRRMLS